MHLPHIASYCHNLPLPRVPNPTQVVQLQVPRETGSFCTHALLAAGTGRGRNRRDSHIAVGPVLHTILDHNHPYQDPSSPIITHHHPSSPIAIHHHPSPIIAEQLSEIVTKPRTFLNTFHPVILCQSCKQPSPASAKTSNPNKGKSGLLKLEANLLK